MRAEEFVTALRQAGWDVARTRDGGFRTCTHPAQHPVDALAGLHLREQPFDLLADLTARNRLGMSCQDSRDVADACAGKPRTTKSQSVYAELSSLSRRLL